MVCTFQSKTLHIHINFILIFLMFPYRLKSHVTHFWILKKVISTKCRAISRSWCKHKIDENVFERALEANGSNEDKMAKARGILGHTRWIKVIRYAASEKSATKFHSWSAWVSAKSVSEVIHTRTVIQNIEKEITFEGVFRYLLRKPHKIL